MRTLTILALTTFTFMIAACNTMSGLGQDIEKGGDNLEKAAERRK